MTGPDAPTEDDSKRDGFLSYAAEWHSMTHGVFKGFTTHPFQTPPQPDNADVRKESHYYAGGYMIGTLLQVGLIAAFTYTGLSF
jgi:hypothetical protein